jgi:hypothetical protein
MTTSDNIGYKLGFAKDEEKQLLDISKKHYVSPSIELSQLNNKGFENFKCH